MVTYCKYCGELHNDNFLCKRYQQELQNHPEWLGEMTDFVTAAAEYHLISSQSLDSVSKIINQHIGTNFSFEGAHQLARDAQVFQKLNEDAFAKCGAFADAQSAKMWLDAHPMGICLKKRLIGAAQEVDWLRSEQGKRLLTKAMLLNGNYPGIDGEIVNRLTGKVTERVTVKAAATAGGINTNVRGVIESLEKGRLSPNDTLFGVEGTKDKLTGQLKKHINDPNYKGNKEILREALKNMNVDESGTNKSVVGSMRRLYDKVEDGQANPYVTVEQAGKMMGKGAVIGAAIELSISSVKNYISYKHGKISAKQAFAEIGEDSTKGALSGAATAGIGIMLPSGPIGWVAATAIMMVVRPTLQNTLDEVFGKGAYREIMNASGYIAATAQNTAGLLGVIAENTARYQENRQHINERQTTAQQTIKEIDDILRRNEPITDRDALQMDTRIYISHQAKEKSQETMEVLRQAAAEAFSESEHNFEVMRNKQWYKRLFEILTFSRNNEKMLAKNIESLSKLQEIIIKALLLMSVQNTELSGDIRNLLESHNLLAEQVKLIAKTQNKLENRLIELEYGGKHELLISELEKHKKSIIIGVYTSFVNKNKKLASKNSKNFTAALHKAFGNNTPTRYDVSYIDKLNSEGEQDLLFKLLQSWMYLATNDFGKQEIFKHFSVSDIRKEELCDQIRTSIENQDVENYINWYAAQEPLYEDDFNIIDESGIELEGTITGIVKRYIDFDDEEIRNIIAQYDACLGTNKLDTNNPANNEEIVKKVNPVISQEAVVGIYNCGCDVILTTHAMYADGKKFTYRLLNENNIELGPIGGGKYKLSLPQSDCTIIDLEIDADMPTLKEMLVSLANLRTASTDEEISFEQLPYSQRIDFYRIMLFIITDSKLPAFDTYALISMLEKKQKDNRFEVFITKPIDLPADVAEYRETIWRFFENVPYPSRQSVSRWAMATALKTLSLTKWSSTISGPQQHLVFCMDYANIRNNENELYNLIEEATLEPSFIDNKHKEKQLYYNKHSTRLNTPMRIGLDIIIPLSYEIFLRKNASDMRKELIRAHLDAYDSIADLFFNEGVAPIGVTENEREEFDKRVKYLRDKL